MWNLDLQILIVDTLQLLWPRKYTLANSAMEQS